MDIFSTGTSSSSSSTITSEDQPNGSLFCSKFVSPCARKILELVNNLRASKGLDALTVCQINRACSLSTHKGLCRAAEVHAARMSEGLAAFSHENALSRINDVGDFDGCGENLARLENYGLENVPQAAVEGWINSPGHYRNMVMPDFNVCGIGVATHYKKAHAVAIDEDIDAYGSAPQQESITFCTFLFGIEREIEPSAGTKIKNHLVGGENMDLTICTCGLIGMAVGGPVTGTMLGMAAGTMIHRAIGITPEGTGYCIKEFAKRELLGLGRLTCTRCNQKAGTKEKDEDVYCDDCWKETHDDDDDDNGEAFVVL